jgi:hypothetical protein
MALNDIAGVDCDGDGDDIVAVVFVGVVDDVVERVLL